MASLHNLPNNCHRNNWRLPPNRNHNPLRNNSSSGQSTRGLHGASTSCLPLSSVRTPLHRGRRHHRFPAMVMPSPRRRPLPENCSSLAASYTNLHAMIYMCSQHEIYPLLSSKRAVKSLPHVSGMPARSSAASSWFGVGTRIQVVRT
jgi:hypothetical protein